MAGLIFNLIKCSKFLHLSNVVNFHTINVQALRSLSTSHSHQRRFKPREFTGDLQDNFEIYTSKDEVLFKPDQFGTLKSNNNVSETFDLEPEEALEYDEENKLDKREEKYLETIADSHRPGVNHFYKKICKLLEKKDLKNALQMFEDMRTDYLVKPNKEIFNVLMHACGQVGYTRGAFYLFRKYRSRGFKPLEITYCSLFNSCANSPESEESLGKSRYLRNKMKRDNFLPTSVLYNNMIKAFGRQGDIKTSFHIMDEMLLDKSVTVDQNTVSHLFHACISDRDAGFRHALLVWSELRKMKRFPTLDNYNLILRACRDCGVGNQNFMSDILPVERISNDSSNFKKLFEADKKETFKNLSSSIDCVETELPNLLKRKPNTNSIVKLGNVLTKYDRFYLIGAKEGFLKMMKWDRVSPDIKTFSLLLSLIQDTEEAEEALILDIKGHNVSPDIDFFNQLIKRRVTRHDYKGAKMVLKIINEFSLTPNNFTFNCVALSVNGRREVKQFLNDYNSLCGQINIETITPLLVNIIIKNRDYKFGIELLGLMRKKNIKPDNIFLNKLEKNRQFVKKNIICKEDGKPVHGRDFYTDEFIKNFYEYSDYYDVWLKEMNLQMPKHPWDQFEFVKRKNY